MSKIVAAPKVEPAKLQEQEAAMREELAEAIASKLLVLVKSAGIDGEEENIVTASWGGASMTRRFRRHRLCLRPRLIRRLSRYFIALFAVTVVVSRRACLLSSSSPWSSSPQIFHMP